MAGQLYARPWLRSFGRAERQSPGTVARLGVRVDRLIRLAVGAQKSYCAFDFDSLAADPKIPFAMSEVSLSRRS